MYVASYQGAFLRFLHSFFVQMPLTLWFKYLSWPLPQSDTFSVAELSLFVEAVHGLATEPFTLNAYGNVPHAAEPRATSVSHEGIVVVSVPDEPVANLVKVNSAWSTHKDPSGAILQLSGLNYTEVHAFTLCGKHARVYAAASQIPAVLKYEFENVILQRLGYDVSQR